MGEKNNEFKEKCSFKEYRKVLSDADLGQFYRPDAVFIRNSQDSSSSTMLIAESSSLMVTGT